MSDENKIDWSDHEQWVVEPVRAITVYGNGNLQIVIMQEQNIDLQQSEDQMIIFPVDQAGKIIHAINAAILEIQEIVDN